MTRLQRDVSGEQLAQKLSMLGYHKVRQTGSHIILTTVVHGEYHLSVPRHSPLQTGTLSRLLHQEAKHQGISVEELIEILQL